MTVDLVSEYWKAFTMYNAQQSQEKGLSKPLYVNTFVKLLA